MSNIDTELQQLPCLSCEQPEIKYVSRAKWVCGNCGKDNSLNYVLAYKALKEEAL